MGGPLEGAANLGVGVVQGAVTRGLDCTERCTETSQAAASARHFASPTPQAIAYRDALLAPTRTARRFLPRISRYTCECVSRSVRDCHRNAVGPPQGRHCPGSNHVNSLSKSVLPGVAANWPRGHPWVWGQQTQPRIRVEHAETFPIRAAGPSKATCALPAVHQCPITCRSSWRGSGCAGGGPPVLVAVEMPVGFEAWV